MSTKHPLQEKIYEVILNRGEGTIFPFHRFEVEKLEAAMKEHPKIVFDYS